VNDTGLSTPGGYWFNNINITGAWQLLGVNASNPRQQSEVLRDAYRRTLLHMPHGVP
jgi:hypothetical protein